MTNIHETAIVSKKAKLGENVEIGPYSVIYDDVEINDDTKIGPHVCIYDGARIGKRVQIFQSASISNVNQDLKYAGEKTYFYIGDDCKIREFVTLHKGTSELGYSKIGNNCLLMDYVHIAHDCILGDNCILSNGVQIGGHVEIGDYVIIGGMTPVHQFSLIGSHTMIGGGFRAVVDIPPYVLAANEPLRFSGLNSVGLKRRGFSSEEINALKKAYEIFYNSGLNFADSKKKLEAEMGDNPHVKLILEFLNKSKRTVLKK
ncbi:MAG: acyl-ACP--UDP-N-acetylglucosamine O-acyltransferase [Ignavibacteria bacterium]|jgi:UDP-N-acetylglucosamine acyltransferase